MCVGGITDGADYDGVSFKVGKSSSKRTDKGKSIGGRYCKYRASLGTEAYLVPRVVCRVGWLVQGVLGNRVQLSPTSTLDSAGTYVQYLRSSYLLFKNLAGTSVPEIRRHAAWRERINGALTAWLGALEA